jgi:hypothetical protein
LKTHSGDVIANQGSLEALNESREANPGEIEALPGFKVLYTGALEALHLAMEAHRRVKEAHLEP